MRYAISVLLLPVLFLIGCTAVVSDNNGAPAPETAVSADPAQLENSWLLLELNGRPLVAGTEISLNFENDALGGNSGCNVYGGSYAAGADGRIEIGDMFSTLMACLDDGVMEQESAYNSALSDAVAFELTDNDQTLLLRNAAGEITLRFSVRAAEETADLSGGVWELTAIIEGETASSLLAGSAITLEFDAETGSLYGAAGCNNYHAAYTLDGGKLSVGPAASTRMFCGEPEGLMAQETQYLSWLEGVTGYEIDGHQLTLILSEGRNLLFTLQ
jgi:heat shock protein HslJ